MNGISDVNPFVGPRPIQQGEALHGRESEVRELYNQLLARRIVVLHSPSGAGKSSLVQAGLIPCLRADNFDVWKPIRVNLDPTGFEGLPADTNRYLFSALVSLEDELPAKRRRSPAELAKLDFLEYLESRPRRRSRVDKSVVLLFDQFEEVLSVAPRAVAAKEEFFAAVGRALDTDKYWALFIIREDYLAALAPYRDRIPTHMFNTVRLDLLGLSGAREAAVNLAKTGGRSFPAVDKLVRDLSTVQVQQADGSFAAEQGLHVEPVYLQVVCRRLWDAMPADELVIDQVHLEAHAEVSKSLAAYYSDAVQAIADGDAGTERSLRDWIGNKLIISGIRSQVRQERGASAGLDNHKIEQLLDCYLVRTEQRAGANWFELSHDRLVEPIQKDNEAWERAHLHPLQVQAKLWEDGGRARALLYSAEALPSALEWAEEHPGLLTESEQTFLEQSQSLALSQMQQRRRQRRFMAALAVVAVVALVFGGFALSLKTTAEQATQRAQADQEKARRAEEEAKQATLVAQVERDKAKVERDKAKQATAAARTAQAESDQAVMRMFEVSLRPFKQNLADNDLEAGEVVGGEDWTSVLELDGQTIVAATVGKKHRLVAAGHPTILTVRDKSGYSLFIKIAVNWLLADQDTTGVVIITRQTDSEERLKILKTNLSVAEGEVFTSLDQLGDAGMLIIDDRWEDFSAAEIDAVKAFVDRGGGVLAVGEGAAWKASRSNDGTEPSMADYPMNELLSAFRVSWNDETVDPAGFEKEVRFENKYGRTIDICSVESGVKSSECQTLQPREILTVRTTVSRWVFRDAENNSKIGEAANQRDIVIGPKPKPEKPRPKSLSAAMAAIERASKGCAETLPHVNVQFTVGPDGVVTGTPRVVGGSGGEKVRRCVVPKVKDQLFPESAAGSYNKRIRLR